MAFALLDDQFHSHPKFMAAGLEARGLYVAALSYCAAYTTDGFVPGSWVGHLGGRKVQQRLVEVKAWTLATRNQRFTLTASDGVEEVLVAPEDGYLIPDYLDYNPSRRQLAERLAQRVEAGKRGGKKRWRSDGESVADTMTPAIAPAIAPAMADGQQMLSSPRASVAQPLPLKKRTSLKETKDVRAPDLLWDALDPVYGPVTNDGERGRRNKALKLIRQSLNGVPESEAAVEVGRRAVVCHALYPLGREMALANHWAELGEATGVVGRKRTGWRWVRGSGGGTYVRDELGTDPLPPGYVTGAA